MAVSSGDALPVALLCSMREALPPHAHILNLYGCTEVAADCTCLDAGEWLAEARLPSRS